MQGYVDAPDRNAATLIAPLHCDRWRRRAAWVHLRRASGSRGRARRHSAHVPLADFDIPILSQLPVTLLSLGDPLEPGPVEAVRLDASLGCGPLGRGALEHAPRTLTTPPHDGPSLPFAMTAANRALERRPGARTRHRELLPALATGGTRAARAQRKAKECRVLFGTRLTEVVPMPGSTGPSAPR